MKYDVVNLSDKGIWSPIAANEIHSLTSFEFDSNYKNFLLDKANTYVEFSFIRVLD